MENITTEATTVDDASCGRQIERVTIVSNARGKPLDQIQELNLAMEGIGNARTLSSMCPDLHNLNLDMNFLRKISDLAKCKHLKLLSMRVTL